MATILSRERWVRLGWVYSFLKCVHYNGSHYKWWDSAAMIAVCLNGTAFHFIIFQWRWKWRADYKDAILKLPRMLTGIDLSKDLYSIEIEHTHGYHKNLKYTNTSKCLFNLRPKRNGHHFSDLIFRLFSCMKTAAFHLISLQNWSNQQQVKISGNKPVTHLHLVPHICVSESGHHWFR